MLLNWGHGVFKPLFMKTRILHTSIVLGLIAIINLNVSGQTNCLSGKHFETSGVTIGINNFKGLKRFIFLKDTIQVINLPERADDDGKSAFRILESKCNWNNEYTEGQSDFKLLSIDEEGIKSYPTLRVVVKDKLGQIILQYSGEKERIFEIIIN